MPLRRMSLSIVSGLIGIAAFQSMARAQFTVTVQQVGSNVVATGSGSIDTSILGSAGFGPEVAYLGPSTSTVFVGPATTIIPDVYQAAITGPSNFGSGLGMDATSGGGDFVGLAYSADNIDVPSGYVSGASLSDTSTWAGQSLSSLGITPGTYNWIFGPETIFVRPAAPDSATDTDSFTLVIQPVPEPASLSLLGVAALSLLARHRRGS
jgi:hypothetical protein